MIKNGLRMRLLLVWIVNGLLAVGLFLFYRQITVVQERAEALHRDIAFLEENRRVLKERENLFAAWQIYQDRIANFFFGKDRLVQWLEFLEGQARARRLGFEVSSLDEEGSGNPPRLRVTLRGNLADTMQFLRAVETGPYSIGIQEGDIRGGSSPDLPDRLAEDSAKRADQAGERITRITFLLYEISS